MEIMALEYKTKPVIAVGPDIFPMAFISSKTWKKEKNINKENNISFFFDELSGLKTLEKTKSRNNIS